MGSCNNKYEGDISPAHTPIPGKSLPLRANHHQM